MTGPLTALLLALGTAGLPPVPRKVVFPTRRGDVTLDHAAHLARRTSCPKCHGPGQVGKFMDDFGMERAHLVCAGCHREYNGPTNCTGCHDPATRRDAGAARAPGASADESSTTSPE